MGIDRNASLLDLVSEQVMGPSYKDDRRYLIASGVAKVAQIDADDPAVALLVMGVGAYSVSTTQASNDASSGTDKTGGGQGGGAGYSVVEKRQLESGLKEIVQTGIADGMQRLVDLSGTVLRETRSDTSQALWDGLESRLAGKLGETLKAGTRDSVNEAVQTEIKRVVASQVAVTLAPITRYALIASAVSSMMSASILVYLLIR